MGRLVGWHARAGELGVRLLVLHLLWIAWTLRGGVVLGVFPASAAVHAVVRRDAVHGVGDRGHRAVRAEFRAAWHAELVPANVLGYTVGALWAVLLLDRRVLGVVDLGLAGPVLAGLLTLLTVVAFVMTAALPVLASHFAEGPVRLLRRAAVLVVARPWQALANAVVVGVVLSVYYVVPGLVPVFGLALPAWLSFATLWGSGLLPAPAPVPARAADPALVGAAPVPA
ncbi:YesL family protein [Cellulomonas shaoxiangyii]|uniref:DUF624 domain-containing protein n=1 Tax=Cellulomonas shaoxiangyii TaxID=2566013 RepID=A0A4P7SK84_9CELL|nr:DUF624 domain-containing protein [Cellulomonas shaoxiangyii]QCB93546.1 DUF624 domain-containing protein [Cellulomonas shaoxiangyii]TGY86868.1 DUF624 domain-containing protein [Cellulomonas shaoxiangyii]